MIKINFIDSEEYIFKPGLRKELEGRLDSYEPELRRLLPALSKHLHLTVYTSKSVIPETGSSGFASSKNWLLYKLDTGHEKSVEEIIESTFKSVVFHEMHHVARYTLQPWTGELLNEAVAEGLATVFERDYAGSDPLWGRYDEETIKEWAKDFIAIADNDPRPSEDWMFNPPGERRWMGYKVGTYIADQAIRHTPNETSATLFAKTAEDMLSLAKLR